MPTKKAVKEVVENLDVVEEVVDKAIDGVNAVDHASHVAAVATKRGLRKLKNPQAVVIVLGLGGVAVGAALGVGAYFLLKKRLEKQYEARLEQEIEEMRSSYKRRFKNRQPYNTPEEAAEALQSYKDGDKPVRIVREGRLREVSQTENETVETVVDVVEETTEVEENVFLNGQPLLPFDWDQEVETSKRDSESPYVISFEEFQENVNDWQQNNLTYYEGDDVLADEQDMPIPEIEATVGYDNLRRFGHGSQDRNVVYIRNDRTEADFEVVRSPGKYAEQVSGLRHSDEPRKRRSRARWGDDE